MTAVRGLLLGFIFRLRDPLIQQIQPQHNQQRRPVAQQAADPQKIQVVQQEQNPERDQQHRRQRKSRPRAACPDQARKFVHHLSIPALLGRVIRLKAI